MPKLDDLVAVRRHGQAIALSSPPLHESFFHCCRPRRDQDELCPLESNELVRHPARGCAFVRVNPAATFKFMAHSLVDRTDTCDRGGQTLLSRLP
jgi:hypothetical protein